MASAEIKAGDEAALNELDIMSFDFSSMPSVAPAPPTPDVPRCRYDNDILFFRLGDRERTEVPDDLELPCGCHYHWQCLLRQAPHICTTLTCPHCKARLTTPADPPYEPNTIIPAATGLKMMVRYSSGDDGTPEDVDMLPLLTEEAMVIMYPHTARAHTLHDYCALGDTVGISKCLMEAEALSSVGRSMTPAELLVWCDPLRHGRTCLHAAVQHQRYDVAWLLLYVASTLPIAYFSPAILHAVRNLGISRRPEVDAAADIRSIVDINGDTPEMLALQIGGVWDQDLELGVLAPPEVPSGLHVLPPAPPVPLMASMEPTFEA